MKLVFKLKGRYGFRFRRPRNIGLKRSNVKMKNDYAEWAKSRDIRVSTIKDEHDDEFVSVMDSKSWKDRTKKRNQHDVDSKEINDIMES